ncbi:protein MpDOXC8 [Marchantia polymorpha subsp. ruderalis]
MAVDDMSSDNGIAVIDLADIDSGPGFKRICEEVAKACEEWGFFHIINHGVDMSLIRRTQKAYKDFFHLPKEEKKKYAMTKVYQGWYSPELYDDSDVKKFPLNIGNTSECLYYIVLSDNPNHETVFSLIPPDLRPTLLEFTKEVAAAQERVLAAMSVALGLDAAALQKRCESIDVGIRANYYPLQTEGKAVGEILPHSDLPAIVFLFSDTVPGLEIRNDGRWVPVKPVPDAFVVNVGDSLEMMSNGRFRSVEHRATGNETEERMSLVSFYMPAKAATIDPIQELLDESHPPQYGSAKYGDMLSALISQRLNGKAFVNSLKIKS